MKLTTEGEGEITDPAMMRDYATNYQSCKGKRTTYLQCSHKSLRKLLGLWKHNLIAKKLITKYKRKELTLVPLGISCCSVLSLSLILSLLLCYIVWLSHQKTKTADSVIIVKLALSISDLCCCSRTWTAGEQSSQIPRSKWMHNFLPFCWQNLQFYTLVLLSSVASAAGYVWKHSTGKGTFIPHYWGIFSDIKIWLKFHANLNKSRMTTKRQ